MPHETWKHTADGIFTLLGYSIGEGGLLRVPFLVARNGGGAYWIPTVFTFVCSYPAFYLEGVIGQYFQKGPAEVWTFSPAFKGIGISSCLTSLIYCPIGSMFFAWYMYYFYNSFFTPLPWTTCTNDWNTPSCLTSDTNITRNKTEGTRLTSSTEEFWRRKTLSLTEGLDNMGSVRWELALCLTLTNIIITIFLMRNINIRGKVVYVTVLLPVVLVTVFVIKGCLLPGSVTGLLYYLTPDFSKLKNPNMWIESCITATYSMGIGCGVIISSSSHNSTQTNSMKNTLIVTVSDIVTTFYCGIAVFSVLGHLAEKNQHDIAAFQSSGWDIGIITLTNSVSHLPLPNLWAAMLFLMFMLLVIDTTIPCFEVPITALGDQFSYLQNRRWLCVIIVAIPVYLMSLVFSLQGGIYLLTILDWFAMGPPVLFIVAMELIVVSWVFGIPQLDKCTVEMYDQKTPFLLKILLKFVAPLIVTGLFCYSLYTYRSPKYGDYIYPVWANVIGWSVTAVLIFPIPAYFFYTVWKYRRHGFKQAVHKAVRSEVAAVTYRPQRPDIETREAESSLM